MPRRKTRATTRRARSLDEKVLTDQTGHITADIDSLVAQYRKTGTFPRMTVNDGLYGDFSGPQDLQDQFLAVQAAQDRFNDLPSSVRKLADHSPVRLLEMIEDPETLNDLMDAGLILTNEEGDAISRPERPSLVETEAAPAADPVEPSETPTAPTARSEA